ncbi:alpha-glucosidase [Paenibacillus durus]|uniref:Alpha-glucosidase n=1 Tax=Paenibacillus durus ATCC 35681 TaxID=1333534 RepID=A0A0F7F816_PAEDU|nr:alpha-glucosidase [Paenibacillus durus]AKG34173.1 alpha-glucosidase [Paenibacillus durus ATCC 35681]
METRDRNWWKESVVYQIYPRSFQDSGGDGVGDLRGIINRLGYLSDLGIDVIWICPVYDSPNDDNGYDIRDFYKMQAEYGTMEDMLELITTAEALGIRIIMDLVANHTSDEHAWFVESRSSKDNPKRDWYIWKPGSGGEEPTNWESNFGGSAWEYDEHTQEYYLHCFSRKQPDLNWENPEVRRNIFSMMEWWIDKGVAGFRIDAITFIKKDQRFPQLKTEEGRRYAPLAEACLNQPGILDFLHEMKREVLKPRNVMTVAEAPGVPIEQIHDYVDEQSGVFNMIFQFDHVDLDVKPTAKGIYHSWKLTDFKHALSKWQTETAGRGWMALFLENHDHVRSVSKFGSDGRYREESAKMLAAYYFLMRGTPFIYQGQEIGMTNHYFASIEEYRDIESINFHAYGTALGRPEGDILKHLAKRSRDQGRTPMQWSPEPMAGFTSGEPWLRVNPNYTSINVEQSLHDGNSILHFYRKLIRLRRENKALIYGDYREIYKDSEELGGYVRTLGSEQWTVLCNFTDRNVAIPAPLAGDIVLSNLNAHEEGVMKPYETVICKAEYEAG